MDWRCGAVIQIKSLVHRVIHGKSLARAGCLQMVISPNLPQDSLDGFRMIYIRQQKLDGQHRAFHLRFREGGQQLKDEIGSRWLVEVIPDAVGSHMARVPSSRQSFSQIFGYHHHPVAAPASHHAHMIICHSSLHLLALEGSSLSFTAMGAPLTIKLFVAFYLPKPNSINTCWIMVPRISPPMSQLLNWSPWAI